MAKEYNTLPLLMLSTLTPQGEADLEVAYQLLLNEKFLQFIWGTNYNPPNPVSSITNLRTFIDYAISLVPSEKFIIGIPTLAYDWTLPYLPKISSANSLTLNSAIQLASDYGVSIQFDDISHTPFFQYTQYRIDSEIEHIVWSLDARTFHALINLISEYGLHGTGLWNAMIYVPQLWLIINSQYEIIKRLNDTIN